MPCSGMAARKLIREPSSCPAFQAVSSSYTVPGGAMGGKGKEHRARGHPLRRRGWVVGVGSRGGHWEGCVRWSGLHGEEEGRRGGCQDRVAYR